MPLSNVMGTILVDPEEISTRARENDEELMAFGKALNQVLSTKGKQGAVPKVSLQLSLIQLF